MSARRWGNGALGRGASFGIWYFVLHGAASSFCFTLGVIGVRRLRVHPHGWPRLSPAHGCTRVSHADRCWSVCASAGRSLGDLWHGSASSSLLCFKRVTVLVQPGSGRSFLTLCCILPSLRGGSKNRDPVADKIRAPWTSVLSDEGERHTPSKSDPSLAPVMCSFSARVANGWRQRTDPRITKLP